MTRWVVESSLRFRLFVVAVTAALLAVAATQVRKLPVEVLPDFTPTTVEVQTEALGLSAAEVEQLVTVPMEQDLLNGVAFLQDIRSESVPGLSRILLVFQPGTSVYRARQVVAERLTQTAALPQVSKAPRMLQPLSSTDRALLIGMSSDRVSPLRLGVLARWTIAPKLVGVPGVANVSIWGQQDRQLQVEVDPQGLRRRHVTLEQVIETSANALWVSPLTFVEASTPGTGGFVDTANQRLGIQHESPITRAADLARVRVEGTGARRLVLSDVAHVGVGHQPLIGDAVVDGRPGLLLVVQRLPGTNLLQVTRNVERALDELKPGLDGIRFDTHVYRPASYVETSIRNVRLAALLGLGLLAIVLAGVLFRPRTGLIALVVVPLSLVAACLVLWALGKTMNAIALVGLAGAVAVVIDDVVASLDATLRRLSERPDGTSAVARVAEATLAARRPALYGTLLVALAVIPLYVLERQIGAFLPVAVTAWLLACTASLIVALTATPALSALLLTRGRHDEAAAPLARRLRRRYEGGLARLLAARAAWWAPAAVLVAAAAASTPFLGHALLPTFRESDVLVRWAAPPGTSLPEMKRITARASAELRALPGVRDVGAHVGRAVTGDQIVGANAGEIWVAIDPHAGYDTTVASVRRVVAGYPGLSSAVQTYSNGRVRDELGGTNADVAVRLYGENLGILRTQAGRIRRALAGVDGVTGAHVLLPPEEPTLRVEVDLARAERYGIKPGDVRRAATTLLSGLVVGSLFEGQKVFEVVVLGTPATRANLTSVRRLLIDTPTGGHVRLGQVADVRVAPSPTVIRRQAVSRYVDVAATVGGRDRGAVVHDLRHLLASMPFPIEYHAEVLASEGQPLGLLVAVGLTAALGAFLLLQAFLGSWRRAAIAFLALPLSVAGGLAALLASGATLSLGSSIGLLAVLALGARGTVALFDRFRRLELEDPDRPPADLVLCGARDRLLPTVATTLSVAAVFVPVLVLGSRPGLELLQPAAVSILGGLASFLVLTLAVLPALYLRFGFGLAPAREVRESEPVPERAAVLDA